MSSKKNIADFFLERYNNINKYLLNLQKKIIQKII